MRIATRLSALAAGLLLALPALAGDDLGERTPSTFVTLAPVIFAVAWLYVKACERV